MNDQENQTPPPPPESPPPPPPESPPPSPGRPSGPGGEANVPMIILAYLGIFAVIPLVLEQEDPEVQWHAKHGLVLFAVEILLITVLWLGFSIIGMMRPLACLAGLLSIVVSVVLGLLIIAVHIVAIVKGINGERLIIPYVSEYAAKF